MGRPLARSASAEDDNLAGAVLDHVRQNRLAGVHHTEKIDVNCFGPGFGRLFQKRSDRALDGRRAYQNVDSSVVPAHAVDSGVELLEIRDIGADAQCVAAGMLDLEMRQIELGLAAGKQTHLGSGSRETLGPAVCRCHVQRP